MERTTASFSRQGKLSAPTRTGIKKVIEYKFSDDGHKVKITTTMRVRKLANARLSTSALERRSWAKFGEATHEDGSSRLTMVSTEEILLERPRAPVDQKTGLSRGFGFVNFVNKEDAQRAINKLNGYGYDNLILRVEWATPRTN